MWSVALFSTAASLPVCAGLHQYASSVVKGGPDHLTADDMMWLSGDEVMPVHQNLDVHFVPDNGEGLRSVVAHLSADGLKVRYPVEEMEKAEPTPWRTFWDREVCAEKRDEQQMDDYMLVCPRGTPTIWTPKFKLAYMKTPKAASSAFQSHFEEHFPDSEEINPDDLPHDAYVFTFVREPFEQKLAAFAEVDIMTETGLGAPHDSSTTFQNVPRDEDLGRSRFAAFLDDIWHHRFQEGDARRPEHALNQVGLALCTHRVDFIGHLEHLTADWDQIQEEAKVPQEFRTKAMPLVHAAVREGVYRYDENVPLTPELREKICEIYRSEFACLGYDAPAYCRKYGLPEGLQAGGAGEYGLPEA